MRMEPDIDVIVFCRNKQVLVGRSERRNDDGPSRLGVVRTRISNLIVEALPRNHEEEVITMRTHGYI